ncbi:MAG: hypothetical protein KDC53_06325 [Saprospiraceae bacterium]|nr:hypothetical protein [Saprospiraceae bacterium]
MSLMPAFSGLSFVLLTSMGFTQTTWYVTESGAGLKDGTSWANATEILQNAIDSSDAGDQIWVAVGTYYPSDSFEVNGTVGDESRDKTFYIDKNIQLYGGFTGGETDLSERDWSMHSSILHGDIDLNADTSNNSYHIMVINGPIDSSCIIDGFHLVGGNAKGGSLPRGGGAILNGTGNGNDCRPSFRNCTWSDNHADLGGAMYNRGFGAVCAPSIIDCIFKNNSSGGSGGAILNLASNNGSCAPTIINSIFIHNQAGSFGGAIHNLAENGDNSPSILNSVFTNNEASNAGGAIGNVVNGAGQSTPIITNSIIWANGDELASQGGATAIITHSIVLGSGGSGAGWNAPFGVDGGNNLDVDPMFVDTANQDFHLLLASPAINTGVNDSIPQKITTDLAGTNRILFGTVDIGAYEYFQCPEADQPIYVDSSSTSPLLTGLSWDSAFTDLQWAIDLACACPGEESASPIWVAKGTYYPSKNFDANEDGQLNNQGRERTFYMNKNLQLFGGFSGFETVAEQRDWQLNPTILSGDLDQDGEKSGQNAFHVTYIDGTTSAGKIDSSFSLDGFQVLLGNANGSSTSDNGRGAAIYMNGRSGNVCSPSISNCVFRSNAAIAEGGAIYSYGASGESSPSIINCSFIGNTASEGGAIYSSGGSGESSPSIINCSFIDNTASTGGALHNDGKFGVSLSVITNCSFLNCFASSSGGAIYNNGTGGMNTAKISNSIFWDNGDEIILQNAVSSLTNCIFDDGSPDGSVNLPPSMIDGGNNLDAYPLFADPANQDLRLLPYSPAINAGVNDSIPPGITTDLADTTRIIDGIVDIGAYEFPEGDCPRNPVLDERYSPLQGNYPAGMSITLSGVVDVLSTGNVILDAPTVHINPTFAVEHMGLLEVKQVGCE